MTDAKEFINCFVNTEEQRICILMLHLFISCSINYPLCAEFPIVVCRVFWAGGLSLHVYIE